MSRYIARIAAATLVLARRHARRSHGGNSTMSGPDSRACEALPAIDLRACFPRACSVIS